MLPREQERFTTFGNRRQINAIGFLNPTETPFIRLAFE